MLIRFRRGEMAAGEIAGRFHEAWPTVTRHLRVLEEAGLLTPRRSGRERLYRLEEKKLAVVEQWLDWFTSFRRRH